MEKHCHICVIVTTNDMGEGNIKTEKRMKMHFFLMKFGTQNTLISDDYIQRSYMYMELN